MNPLLAEQLNTPFSTIPFDQIKNEHFLPAVKEGIALAKAEYKAISTSTEAPTFENTILAMDKSGVILDRVTSTLFNLNSAETNDEIQKICKDASPLLSEFRTDILFDKGLFNKVKAVYEQRSSLNLSAEQLTLLEKNYRSYKRNGAELPEEKQARIKEISKRLSELSLTFGEHVLAETNKFELVLENEADLDGIPESIREMASMTAQQKGKEGKWVFTLDYPSYVPFMTYASNKALREEMFKAFSSRAFKGDELDNKDIIKELVSLRNEHAQILGYETYAHYVLEERMAGSPDKVFEFLGELRDYGLPAGKEDVKQVTDFAKQLDGTESLARWDYAFYQEKLKKEKFAIDDDLLRPYFKLENVVEGVFTVSEKLFGLSFKENKDIPVYHEEVTAYEVYENGKLKAIFYADFFPREGKRGGAWMTSYQSQYNYSEEENGVPHVSIVCNFTKPTTTKPSLLTFNEVTTLFHEFGHALHGMLANTVYKSLSGTSVYWDFVELPSQIFENWAYEKECLDLFAKHYETGELIPEDYVQKIKDSMTFQEGYQTARQLSFGLLDMDYHSLKDGVVEDVAVFEQGSMNSTLLLPSVDGSNMSCAFSHIFQGGYASGYYSYKWAEVLDADAFELFKQNGIFDKATAESFKENILSKGGSEHPMTLYKRFRGAEPDPKALLRRAGLLK
ncbi:M3 family metallopeptidase [Sediminitomix flava]|nr:M3 family metallopeptidase [Sediminitomix flava]